MTDELGPEPHELHEQVVEAIEDVQEELSQQKRQQLDSRQWLNLIGLSTGIISGLAAIAAMQAGSLANESMLAQIHATDQWALYQARSTKRHIEESTVILLSAQQKPVPSNITAEIKKLEIQQKESQDEAQRLESESRSSLHRHELLAHSVAALQIGISLGAVAALLRQKNVWYLGLGIATIGVGLMMVGLGGGGDLSKASSPTTSMVFQDSR
jgi:YesN/AraC family two-component response regulator